MKTSPPTGVLLKFGICFKKKSSYQWLLPNCKWIYKEQSLKYVLENLYDYVISYRLTPRQELAFAIVEGQLYHTAINVIHTDWLLDKN